MYIAPTDHKPYGKGALQIISWTIQNTDMFFHYRCLHENANVYVIPFPTEGIFNEYRQSMERLEGMVHKFCFLSMTLPEYSSEVAEFGDTLFCSIEELVFQYGKCRVPNHIREIRDHIALTYHIDNGYDWGPYTLTLGGCINQGTLCAPAA
jgi:hypothetical protein